MANENELPKYYNSDFDFSLLSKTELRKILFDHNITPPPYNTLKAELLEFYEINFHKKLKIYRKKYTETLKTIRTGNLTALDLSFDEDNVFPIRDVHEEINNSLNNLTPQKAFNKEKALIKNKEKLISEANHLGSEDIEELEDLLEGIQNKKLENERNSQKFNEELITTPEALRSFSGFNSSFNFEDSFKKREIDPSLGSRTPAFCTFPENSGNFEKKKFSFWNFLSCFLKGIFLLIFLNEILKNLWCPFCLNTKPIFSEDFLKQFLKKETFNFKGKKIFKEFSYCQEKPEYIFFDKKIQEFNFKPGFLKNKNLLTMAFRQFSVEDKMTYELMKTLKIAFFGKSIFRLWPLNLTQKRSSKEVFNFLNESFKNFYKLNFKDFEAFLDDDLKQIAKENNISENFLKETYLKTALDLLIDNPNILYFEKEDVFTFYFTGWNLVEVHFFKFLCGFLVFLFLKRGIEKFKRERREGEFVKKIVNEILQGGMELREEELRECYSEVEDSVWQRVLKGLKN